jgi:hypothetical protein
MNVATLYVECFIYMNVASFYVVMTHPFFEKICLELESLGMPLQNVKWKLSADLLCNNTSLCEKIILARDHGLDVRRVALRLSKRTVMVMVVRSAP